MKLSIEEALRNGISAHEAGDINKADRYYTAILKVNSKHPVANHNLGVIAARIGKATEALKFFEAAIISNPNFPQFRISYIECLIQLNRVEDAFSSVVDAEAHYGNLPEFAAVKEKLGQMTRRPVPRNKKTKNLSSEPDEVEKKKLRDLSDSADFESVIVEANKLLPKYHRSIILNNFLGTALHSLGRSNEAIAHYNEAISIQPTSAAIWCNLGNALKSIGDFVKAERAYDKAILLQPELYQAYYNLGEMYHARRALKEARANYEKALSINPSYILALNNLGNVLKDQGHLSEALGAYCKAIQLDSNFVEALLNLGNSLRGVKFLKRDSDMLDVISKLVDKNNLVAPNSIVKPAISLIKLEPDFADCIKWADDYENNYLSLVQSLITQPLLIKFMSLCPLPDKEIETLFSGLREYLLINHAELIETPDLVSFLAALALQCHANEYVYKVSADADKKLKRLKLDVENLAQNGERPNIVKVLILASFLSLDELSVDLDSQDFAKINKVIARQVLEPKKEKAIRKSISSLGDVNDTVSNQVRRQYEENPYPRWVSTSLFLKPLTIQNVVKELNLNLYNRNIEENKMPQVLIAGCGTGAHSISTASRFKNSTVLALDLSLASLSYAKRKSDELSVDNIKYIQGDILDLEKLDQKFDIIESAGVLHHMSNPLKGWEKLTSRLKTGGLMKIGLYSELARQHITRIRNEITELGLGTSDAEMKSLRDQILSSNEEHHQLLWQTDDFYSLSNVRDLLFHVQEHTFTIPQIEAALRELNLHFCGFESQEIVSQFKLRFPDDNCSYELSNWHAFELENPSTFVGMYQFWCQKA